MESLFILAIFSLVFYMGVRTHVAEYLEGLDLDE